MPQNHNQRYSQHLGPRVVASHEKLHVLGAKLPRRVREERVKSTKPLREIQVTAAAIHFERRCHLQLGGGAVDAVQPLSIAAVNEKIGL